MKWKVFFHLPNAPEIMESMVVEGVDESQAKIAFYRKVAAKTFPFVLDYIVPWREPKEPDGANS